MHFGDLSTTFEFVYRVFDNQWKTLSTVQLSYLYQVRYVFICNILCDYTVCFMLSVVFL